MAAICKQHDYRLTVYIDDVTISGQALSPEVLWQVKHAIHRSGLRYHKEKVYVDRPAEITGVIVRGSYLLPPNRQLKKLRDLKHSVANTASENDAKELHERIAGLKGQMSQIGLASKKWRVPNE